eukprot:TRINITY_DN27715_c0_g1_i1.p2 TRINITY_DN27715_c0_g1~~TRINITY_DN27715_c0_g1_i1.p2  ORF type:complete len:207 (+),score=99.75 TRINITY_DN27715_c0_g1_i1:64-621(+)
MDGMVGAAQEDIKAPLDFTDGHLLATLASLMVSLPMFLYFAYQVLAHADFDAVYNEQDHAYTAREPAAGPARPRRRLRHRLVTGAAADPDDVLTPQGAPPPAAARPADLAAQLQSLLDESDASNATPPGTPPRGRLAEDAFGKHSDAAGPATLRRRHPDAAAATSPKGAKQKKKHDNDSDKAKGD